LANEKLYKFLIKLRKENDDTRKIRLTNTYLRKSINVDKDEYNRDIVMFIVMFSYVYKNRLSALYSSKST
jgi:hypothetical protein